MSQLSDLARPFPRQFVNDNPTGFGSYVAHHIVNQRLLQVVGPFSWGCRDIIRGDLPEQGDKPALHNVIVGAMGRLSCIVDGEFAIIEEAGDCENPRNWPHDGARLKDAMSDAFKRCAMRLGLGLHLWSQADYYLYDRLREAEESPPVEVETDDGGTGEPRASVPPESVGMAS